MRPCCVGHGDESGCALHSTQSARLGVVLKRAALCLTASRRQQPRSSQMLCVSRCSEPLPSPTFSVLLSSGRLTKRRHILTSCLTEDLVCCA
ncbi:unnamed protein product [Toxocara canis]|uniref:Uncharacterized protein n=1 Tax=Toxocara canis TaxID=6265 RepID=A0A183UFW3_TOXCA|nr:unnamed protein product [Toxocara canis]